MNSLIIGGVQDGNYYNLKDVDINRGWITLAAIPKLPQIGIKGDEFIPEDEADIPFLHTTYEVRPFYFDVDGLDDSIYGEIVHLLIESGMTTLQAFKKLCYYYKPEK